MTDIDQQLARHLHAACALARMVQDLIPAAFAINRED